MVQIFMTMDGVLSSILCGRGRVVAVAAVRPAADVITAHFANAPIPAHENGVISCK